MHGTMKMKWIIDWEERFFLLSRRIDKKKRIDIFQWHKYLRLHRWLRCSVQATFTLWQPKHWGIQPFMSSRYHRRSEESIYIGCIQDWFASQLALDWHDYFHYCKYLSCETAHFRSLGRNKRQLYVNTKNGIVAGYKRTHIKQNDPRDLLFAPLIAPNMHSVKNSTCFNYCHNMNETQCGNICKAANHCSACHTSFVKTLPCMPLLICTFSLLPESSLADCILSSIGTLTLLILCA